MNLSIKLRSDQQRTFVGFVKDDVVALYILDKSEGSFYFQNAIRCENLQLNFWAKSPFPVEPKHQRTHIIIIRTFMLMHIMIFVWYLVDQALPNMQGFIGPIGPLVTPA